MAEVAAILLAAGLSARMGATNKLVLPIAGQPMIARLAAVYLSAADTLTVVTGHDAPEIRAALAGYDVRFAHNADYASGRPLSVATGLRAAPDAEVLLIGLGDQPLLTPQDLKDLLQAHRTAAPQKITIPHHNGLRGNPIVVPRHLRPRLTENPDRPGCMRFTRDHPEHVHVAPLPARGFYTDVDTPADYAALEDVS